MAVRARVIILLVLLLASFAAALWFSPARASSPVENALAQLRTNRWNSDEKASATAELARLGDAAIPFLASALKDKDTTFDRTYDRWRAKLAGNSQVLLPDRPSKDELRRTVATSIHEIGPTASRALVGKIEYAIEPSLGFQNWEILHSLYWSIPESPKAIQILSNYLAHPAPGLPLFGAKDAEEIWPHVPHLAPLLVPWLSFADTAREAAIGLSLMGTNAHFAIPQIIELAEKGYVGPPSNSTLHVSYVPNLATNILRHNKAAALKALGTFRLATPQVLGTIQKNFTNESPFLRACAANALGDLGPAGTPLLPTLVENLDQTHAMVLRYQLEAIGKMGPAAKTALPALLRFADGSIAAQIPRGEPFGFTVRGLWEPLPLPCVAAVAVAKVDPTAAKPVVQQIADAFNSHLTTNEIVGLRPMLPDLLPHLEALSEQGGSRFLPYHILLLDPANERARKALQTLMHPEKSFRLRSVAARWHFNVFRDTNLVLEVFRQTLPQVRDLNDQTPVTLAGQLGPAARLLVPLLKPVLTNKNSIMRTLAGKAIRAIAPDQMPPINEDSF